MTLLIVLAVILLLVSVNALYVAAEFATVGARRTRVSELAEAGDRAAAQLLPIMQDPVQLDRYIAACQIGITLSSIIVGFYGQAQLVPFLSPLLMSLGGLQTAAAVALSATVLLIVLTLFQVIFGELLPKSIALRYPERIALATMRPMVWSLALLRPFIALLNGSAFALMRLFKISVTSEHAHVHSPDELETLFYESAKGGLIDVGEREMLQNVLHLPERLARQIMMPRTRVEAVAVDSDPLEVYDRLLASTHTRFPVYEATIDRVVGTLRLGDLALAVRREGAPALRPLVRPVLLLPETVTVSALWEEMRTQACSMAVLFDEYGGVSGMVTLEDILEEVFGELQDEFDRETDLVREGPDGRLYLRADLLVSGANRRFGLKLPEDDADTLGGLVLDRLEHLPRVGETVALAGTVLRVEVVQEGSVRQVSVPQPSADAPEQDEAAS